jgi:hypothetical protein
MKLNLNLTGAASLKSRTSAVFCSYPRLQNSRSKPAITIAYAEEALKYVESHARLPRSSRGNAVFYGNLVLGQLALLRDDVQQAENYLLTAGTTTGSPVFNTFGQTCL